MADFNLPRSVTLRRNIAQYLMRKHRYSSIAAIEEDVESKVYILVESRLRQAKAVSQKDTGKALDIYLRAHELAGDAVAAHEVSFRQAENIIYGATITNAIEEAERHLKHNNFTDALLSLEAAEILSEEKGLKIPEIATGLYKTAYCQAKEFQGQTTPSHSRLLEDLAKRAGEAPPEEIHQPGLAHTIKGVFSSVLPFLAAFYKN